MSDSFFVGDGYSRTVRIEGVKGLHPTLTIRFRPALAEARYQFLQGKDLDGRDQSRRTASVLKEHLETWDATQRDGQRAEITEHTLMRLHPALQSKILDIVLGYAPAEEAADEKN